MMTSRNAEANYCGLADEYSLMKFVGGLQGEIKGTFRLLEPTTLPSASSKVS